MSKGCIVSSQLPHSVLSEAGYLFVTTMVSKLAL